MKPSAVTLPMLRAACALSGMRLPFIGKTFQAERNGKTVFFKLSVVEGLERRGLAEIRRQNDRITSAKLTRAGVRLVNANPPTCIGCGCIDARACQGGCYWVAPGWCSACDQAAA